MSINYTEEQVEYMKELYSANPSRETVEILSKELNKSAKSIIGKLSREGVYQKTVYKTKTGEDPITKKELVENLADYLDLNPDWIAGLEKSPKADLKRVCERVEEFAANAENNETECYHLVWRGE